jgi:hypothetical protein
MQSFSEEENVNGGENVKGEKKENDKKCGQGESG